MQLYPYHILAFINFLQFVLQGTFMIYDGLCVYAFPDFCVCVGGGGVVCDGRIHWYLILCLERACGKLHQGTAGNID